MVNIFGKLPSTVGGKRRKRVKVHGDATSISRNFEGVKGSNSGSGRPIGKEEVIYLGDIEWIQAHRYVINSLSIVDDYKKNTCMYLSMKIHACQVTIWRKFTVKLLMIGLKLKLGNWSKQMVVIVFMKTFVTWLLVQVDGLDDIPDDSYIQQPNDVDIVHNDTSWARADVEGVTLDPPSPKAKRSRRFGEVDPNDLSSSDEEIMYASDGSDAPSDDDDFFEQRNVANEDSEA
ncbi:OLC1v1024492C1 [Oldenlandia corymbosa var. corymbosa]|uniref:OLC1v1024492C1 n=1 Tax=Oldenlandia corymbosa var. corymbosa TaxID=529605 RepID=A0AAV1C2Q0_OLDCO|nr:OLC1v1024492C1 [Oldenlandia corymbosa var. corymbosa]